VSAVFAIISVLRSRLLLPVFLALGAALLIQVVVAVALTRTTVAVLEDDLAQGMQRDTGRLVDDLTKAGEIFFKEENEDIKSVICFIVRDRLGERGLLDMLKAEMYAEETVDHGPEYSETLRLYRTKEKYSFLMDSKETPNQPYCWLEYTCPSTGTVYLIDTFADFKTPIEAAKFHRPEGVPFEVDYKWEYFAN
jgi:hypothetical protein